MNLWSDEDRLFVPRLLGWSINFKFIAKKLGLIKTVKPVDRESAEQMAQSTASPEDRIREALERSKYEEK